MRRIISEYIPEDKEERYRLREENGTLYLDRFSTNAGAWLGFYELDQRHARWLMENLGNWLFD